MTDDFILSPGELTHRVRSTEDRLERVEAMQATYVTAEVLRLHMEAMRNEVVGKLDNITTVVTEVKSDVSEVKAEQVAIKKAAAEASSRWMTSLLFPVLAGLVIAVIGALIIAGLGGVAI